MELPQGSNFILQYFSATFLGNWGLQAFADLEYCVEGAFCNSHVVAAFFFTVTQGECETKT